MCVLREEKQQGKRSELEALQRAAPICGFAGGGSGCGWKHLERIWR
jgi:hypothetical protein